MVKLRIKVGPKGQILIPKILRKKYGIKENDYVIIEANDENLVIKRAPSINESLSWLREKRKKIKAKQAKLGDLAQVDLEDEFDESIG
jgi:AbrB family looped-hinge helix DNA binding protein